MQKAKPGLGEHHYEDQLILNLRESLKDHMVRYHPYLASSDRGIILNFYDKRIDRENILQLYPHPCEDFLHALIADDLNSLLGKSAARLKRNPFPKTK